MARDSYDEKYQLDRKALRQRADFLERYACRTLEEMEVRRADFSDELSMRKAIAATAFLEGAEAAILFDMERAQSLALKAAKEYIDLGMPVGLILKGVFGGRHDSRSALFNSPLGSWLFAAASDETEKAMPQRRGSSGSDRELPDALRHPVQQFYLVIAAMLHPEVHHEFNKPVGTVMKRLGQLSAMSVGPSNARLLNYMDVMEGVDSNREQSSKSFPQDRKTTDAIETLFAAHAESLAQAQRNKYLWRRILSPVSLIDLPALAIGTAYVRGAVQKESDVGALKEEMSATFSRRSEMRRQDERPFIKACADMTMELAISRPQPLSELD